MYFELAQVAEMVPAHNAKGIQFGQNTHSALFGECYIKYWFNKMHMILNG